MMITDSEIEREVECAVRECAGVTTDALHVTVEGGVVTLTGTVPTDDARTAIRESLHGMEGVRELRDQLTVRHASGADDEQERRVRSQVLKRLDAGGIAAPADVEVRWGNGILTLLGSVDTREKRVRAEQAAASVPGVARIRNGLAVVPTGSDEDKHLALRILRTLEHTFILSDPTRIVLQVVNGTVTFTGPVPDMFVRWRLESCLRGIEGVTRVRNCLALT